MKVYIITVVAAIAGAISSDLDSYYKARKADPSVPFRWDLFLIRGFKGLCLGLGAIAAIGG